MTNDEMIQVATMLLDFKDEWRELDNKIEVLMSERGEIAKSALDQEKMLLECVGANITERIIPIGDKAVIIEYRHDGNKVRISNRVVIRDHV